MSESRTGRSAALVILAVTLVLASGGAVVASNMGFKLNKPLTRVPPPPAPVGQTGNNWTSIPYINPYWTINGFCTQTGLQSTGITRTQITTKNYVSDTEGFKTYNCGQTNPLPPALVPGKMIQIRQTPTGLQNIIIVGSHDPSRRITITENTDAWIGLPYNTTLVNTSDLCAYMGLTSTGTRRASVTPLNPGSNSGASASFQMSTCGSLTTFFNLVLGEGLQVREANNIPGTQVISVIPAHY